MAKVIVERPRREGSLSKHRDAYRSARGRHSRDIEDLPNHESMKSRYFDRKELNENLRPLWRWLDKQVGRPWNKVYSELCARIDIRNTVQKHVRDHLNQEVEIRGVAIVDGVPHKYEFGDLRPINGLYVCPKSGLLKRANGVRRPYREPKIDVVYADRSCFGCDNGTWYELTLAPLPDVVVDRVAADGRTVKGYAFVYDVHLGRGVSFHSYISHRGVLLRFGCYDSHRTYGNDAVYCRHRRQLALTEIFALGLRKRMAA